MAILIDTSKSMKKSHRNQLKVLLDRLIDYLGVSPEGNHYAVITFDHGAVVHYNFTDPWFYNKENLKSEVQACVNYKPSGWGTRTDVAMNLAATQLFTPQGGDRPNAENAMLIMTDGKPRKPGRDKTPISFSQITKALEVSRTLLIKTILKLQKSR